MARIPVYGERRTAQRSIPTPFNTSRPEVPSLSGVLDRVGQLAGSAAEAYVDEQEKAKQRADEVAVSQAETWLQHEYNQELIGDSTAEGLPIPEAAGGGGGTRRKGFLELQGMEAAAASSDVSKRISKHRESVAARLTNPEQRELFLKRTAGVQLDALRNVERHVGGQVRAAEVATLKARTDVALNAIASDYTNDVAAARQVSGLEASIRALQLSPEDGDAKIEDLQRAATSVRLNQYLATRDWRNAQALYARDKAKLGADAVQFEKQIAAVRESQEAEATATKMLEFARDPATGRVDQKQANAAIESIPEGPLRDEIRKRLEHGVMKAEREWQGRISDTFDQAFTAYLKGGRTTAAVDPRVKSWLVENAPVEWNKLEMMERSDREYARNQRERRAGGRSRGETEEQRLAFIELKADITENPERYKGMTPAEFHREWGPRLSSGDFEAGGTLFASTKKEQKEGAGEFSRFVTDEVRGNAVLQKNKKKADRFRAFMGDRRREFIQKNGKEPSYTDLEAMRDAAWKVTVEDGLLWDSETPAFLAEPEAKAAPKEGSAPAPTYRRALEPSAPKTEPQPKKVKSYRRSPDGTRRVPVYEDGTYGPEEKVR